jgi:hypothetical protein
MIPEYVALLQKEHAWQYQPHTTKKLLTMSEATVKRRIATFVKERTSVKGRSTTKPSDLKMLVPIFTGPWSEKPPGYGQVDTVAHCGSTASGDYVYTLNYTDVATLWTRPVAQWNKGKHATCESLKTVRQYLPFPMKGLHPDTGSEFLNWHVVPWCQKEHIELTRGRPNHKNDNQYIEERNGHIVRKYAGYIRLDVPEVVETLNTLYNVLSDYLNHFIPVRRCARKERIGSRYKRTYDAPQTPYQRVMKHNHVSAEDKRKLYREHNRLNIVELKRQIEAYTKELYDTQKRHG